MRTIRSSSRLLGRGCLLQCMLGYTSPGPGPGPPLHLWTDRHLWKHNLRKLRLRAVKMYKYVCYTRFLCVIYHTTSPTHRKVWLATDSAENSTQSWHQISNLRTWVTLLCVLICLSYVGGDGEGGWDIPLSLKYYFTSQHQ